MRKIPSPFVRNIWPTIYLDPTTLDRSVWDWNWGVKVDRRLRELKINTIRELVLKSEAELLDGVNFGKRSLRELTYILQKEGLTLGLTEGDLASLPTD